MSIENQKPNNLIIISTALFLILDIFVWFLIFYPPITSPADRNLKIYFLDVGQGDSELIVLPNGVKILVDGGPDKKILDSLSRVLPFTDRRIDLVISSHPQLDHFSGLLDIMRRYQVGVFINNGQTSDSLAWRELENILTKKKITSLSLGAGDRILHGKSALEVISPDSFLKSKDVNESALVLFLESKNTKVLFTGDIGAKTENYLVQKYSLSADVLKVSHHGSRFSSTGEFISTLAPKIAVIEVGKNSYGHPTAAALANLTEVGAQIYRTDKNGTVRILSDGEKITVFSEK